MAHTVEDSRTVDTRPIGSISKWLVANDKFVSHWGRAPKRSIVAYPVDELSYESFNELFSFCKGRSDFVYARVQGKLPRMHDGDHLSIYDVPSRFVDKERK